MEKKRILVTGFGPFPGVDDNPSARLMEILAQPRIAQAFNLEARILPTEYAGAVRELRKALDEVKPDIVVCFGVAAKIDRIQWERAAWNNVSTDKKDAAGHRHKTCVIVSGAAAGYASNLPLPDIAADLARVGLPCAASNNAGDYLCNYIFYSLMHDTAQEMAKGGQARKAGFVHIPMPHDRPDDKIPLTMKGIADAAVIILRACVRDADKPQMPRVLNDRVLLTSRKQRGPQ